MRHAAIYLAAVTLTVFSTQHCQAEIAWEAKLRDAHTKAKKQGKLMLLHFYSDNCVWCDRLEAGAFSQDSVSSAINQNFVPVKIHGGKNPKLAQMFKVEKYPTDVIVTTDGKALSHSVSPQAPERYIAMLGSVRNAKTKTNTMVAANSQPTTKTEPAAVKAKDTAATASQPVAKTPSYAQKSTSPAATSPTNVAAAAPSGFAMPAASGAKPNKPAALSTPVPSAAVAASEPAMPSSGSNGFVLPKAKTGNMQTALTGTRTDGMSLAPPTSDEITKPLSAKASDQAAKKPELAIQGYCAVSVVKDGKWVEGKPEFGVVHLGKLYLFSTEEAMNTFLDEPIPYTPMLNGIDVVRFFEEKIIVPGNREWGVVDQVHNRMFFFADEESLIWFEKNYDLYVDAAIQVMDEAVKAANPGA